MPFKFNSSLHVAVNNRKSLCEAEHVNKLQGSLVMNKGSHLRNTELVIKVIMKKCNDSH
jgi:hypothetical protein